MDNLVDKVEVNTIMWPLLIGLGKIQGEPEFSLELYWAQYQDNNIMNVGDETRFFVLELYSCISISGSKFMHLNQT